MRPFNLAETRIAERTYCKAQIRRRLRTIALLAVLTLCVGAVSYGCRTTIRNRSSHLTSELADVQARCLKTKAEIAAIKTKSDQRKWQSELTDGSKRWLGYLDAILARVPGDMWLSRIESSQSGSSISVDGYAASFSSLSGFIGSVKSCPEFSEAMITSARVSGAGADTCVSFSLIAKLKTAATAQAPASTTSVPPVQESP